MADPIRQDLDAPYWTLDQAAAHFGITRRAVRLMITTGLPTYFAGTMVKPAEYIAVRLERQKAQRASRLQSRDTQPRNAR
jgi:hypothetical protein